MNLNVAASKAMPQTITQKIMARAAGLTSVKVGSQLRVKPRFVLAYDFPGVMDVVFKQLKTEFGIQRMRDPSRYGLFIDHMVPPQKPSEEAVHEITRNWANANGVALYEREGIGHQVAAEKGFGLPGALVVHFDRHVSALGAFGTLAFGIRRQILEAFAFDEVDMQVPQSVKIIFRGRPPAGVMARDVFNHLIARLGPGNCCDQVLEIEGPAIAKLSVDDRMTICGLATFTGAVSAIIVPDETTISWLRSKTDKALEPLYGDSDAEYAAVHEFDLSEVSPYVVIPPSPANVVPLAEIAGQHIDQGYIGSCVSGRLEDIRAAAHVLKERSIKPGFRLNVIPTSQNIMREAMREGLLEVLMKSGAFVSASSCDYCYGKIQALAPGQFALSTGPLNIPGRMGSTEARVYIASAATIAASAIEGQIADPRKYFSAH